ncbi:hypothetical protein N7456_012402 [Penicillium angulare]|uniref:NACHT domain-containing protein n=1 Tax=Penicillium angulare TaxID=116970 RepID=A0A9W9K135_9EURO|nr:hypothetical protein N7456_012402 [Penicillium angulare]
MPNPFKKLRARKKIHAEKDSLLSEDPTPSTHSLAVQVHIEPPPDDIWARAEQELTRNGDLNKVFTESLRILEENYNLNLQPGGPGRHKALCEFLEDRACQVEEKKWTIHLGTHEVVVRDQLTVVFKRLLAIKDIVTAAASVSLPASLACAGIMACFTVVVQAAEQNDLLLKGLDSISGLICRLPVLERLYLHPSSYYQKTPDADLFGNLQDTLVSLCSKILEFQARALCYLHRSSASQFVRNLFDRDGWAGLLKDFERYEESIGRTTSLISNAGSVQRHGEVIDAIQKRDIWTTTSVRDERVKKFLNLLYTCPYQDRKDRNGKRVPGTCEWFTRHHIFRAWQQSPGNDLSGLLLVSADPGCGKSVLTRYLVDELLLNNNERTVCYFFFKDDFSDQKSVTSALSAILRQLFIAKPQLLPDAILDKLETDGERLFQSFSELWNILVSVSANPKAGEIVCILDALDECQDDDRNLFIDNIKEFYLVNYTNRKLKFLMTSRPYDHIRRGFWKLEARLPTIYLSGDGEEEAEQISEEIGLVIRKRVDDIGEQRSLEEDECAMLTEQLTSVENRTYLWVSLTLDVLENMPGFTRGNIRRAIWNLPKTVDSAYEKILDRSLDKDRSRFILRLITTAMQPLSLGDLSLALAININAENLSLTAVNDDIEPDERFKKTLRDLCGLFVVVVDGRVYLLHQTAKEFLVCDQDSPTDLHMSQITGWKHSLHPHESNRALLDICMILLSLDWDGVRQETLYGYSTLHWAAHLRKTSIQFEDTIIVHARSICDVISNEYPKWFQIFFKIRREKIPLGVSTFWIAAYFRLTGVMKLLLDEGKADLNCENIYNWRTPLSYAAMHGDEAVVKLLLDTGRVDIDSKNIYRRAPLSYAAEHGHEEVVKLLLDTGKVDINSQDIYGFTALHYAAKSGQAAVVKLLLDGEKVDVELEDMHGWTPLSSAFEFNGSEELEVVKLFLDTKDWNLGPARKQVFWEILHDAARFDNEGALRLFVDLEKLHIFQMKDQDSSSVLHWAAKFGNEEAVKFLIDMCRVDVNHKNAYGMTPLHFAAMFGNERIVKLLLDTGEVEIDQIADSETLSGNEAVLSLLQEYSTKVGLPAPTQPRSFHCSYS